MHSDDRKTISFNLGGSNYWGYNNENRRKNYWVGATFKPGKSFSIEVSPRYNNRFSQIQYVNTIELDNDEEASTQ